MTDKPVYGQQELSSGNTPFNELSFVVQQMLGRINVATLVKVVAVNATGGDAPVGTVDVLPLVNQIAGDGSAVPHTTIHGLPYFRLQGGSNAIICDPQKGDIGFCVFADRDISSVQASATQGNPGSARRFDMADGLYLGGWNSTITPDQYIQLGAGITIQSPQVTTSENFSAGSGASGSFTTPMGQVVTVQNGIITNIF